MLAFVLGHFVSHKCSVAFAVVVSSFRFAVVVEEQTRSACKCGRRQGRSAQEIFDFEINFQNPSAKFSNIGINLGILCGLA
jgi:hypothetical protein